MHMDSVQQQFGCSHYGMVQIGRMNTARLQILSCKSPESCKLCAEGALIKQGGAGTKESGGKEEEEEEAVVVEEEEEKTKIQQKKKKKKKKKQQKQDAKKDGDHLWVCLECSQYFCDGADSVPHGHVREHWKKTGHCWSANYKNPTLVHCFKCRHNVSIRIPDLLPAPKKTTPLGMEPKPPLHTEDDWNWDWNSDWDSEDDRDDKITTKTSVDEDQWSTPVKVSSPPLDDNLETKQTPPVSKDDIAISGSTANQTETHSNVIRGLENIGNTCFFNVILQSLLALDSLRCKFIGTDVGTGPVGVSLQQLFIETSSSNNRRGVFNPENLFTTVCNRWPLFKKGKMEDAEELLMLFLAGLEEEEAATRTLSGDASNVPSIFDSIFAGQECSTVSSKGCTHGSRTPQLTLMFQLPIPPGRLPSVAQSESMPSSSSNRAHDDVHDSDTLTSLEDCFSLYTEEEELPKWYCEDCTASDNAKRSETKPVVEAAGLKEDEKGVYRTATKRILITKAPEVLVVTFRRYRPVSVNRYEKLEGHVQFKEFLDIGPYRDKRCNETENNTYRLVSVVEHRGNPDGGHYIAYIRASKMAGHQHESNDSKTWFSASDDKIREVNIHEVLSCEAYILFYERCPADAFRSSAIVMGEEPRRTDTDLWPQRDLFSEPIPPPREHWNQQWSRNRHKRREQTIATNDAMLLPKFWVFLDQFTPSGDDLPYYRFLLATMVNMGLRSGQLNISYQHLVSHSKELAMDVCNGYTRLQVMLMETAREYMQQLATKLGVTERAKDLMQHLELNFLGMPQMHEELKQCLSTDLLRQMDVFGHTGSPIMVPVPDKCALVQSLIAHVVSKHRAGFSWEGEFGIDDMDVIDGKVVITKSPKLFVIKPKISHQMVKAMEKDFNSIKTTAVEKFSRPKTYVPYLSPFMTLLGGMDSYSHWWSKTDKAEHLREWIQHFPFLKPSMTRYNLLVDIFTASRSYDKGDRTQRFKIILDRALEPWTNLLNQTTNQMVHDVLHYKDPLQNVVYYKEELSFLFELLRHLAQHGTEKSFDKTPPAWHGAPRKQLVRMLDELEIAGAYELEKAVVAALLKLLETDAMDGMLKSIWECYKFCNYPYRE